MCYTTQYPVITRLFCDNQLKKKKIAATIAALRICRLESLISITFWGQSSCKSSAVYKRFAKILSGLVHAVNCKQLLAILKVFFIFLFLNECKGDNHYHHVIASVILEFSYYYCLTHYCQKVPNLLHHLF